MAKFDKFLGKIVERVVGGVIDPGVVPDASTSTKGIIEIATGAEVTAGTDTSRAVVPSTLKTELDKKVDKVAGKGLSTNDYDNTEKAKVAAALTSVPDATDTVKGVVNVANLDDIFQIANDTLPTNRNRVPRLIDLHAIATMKVDRVAGKGLSTNDYDNTEKAKVAAAETETTLGLDPAAGDTTKFLNQKKQWAVPAGGSSVPDASTSTKGIIQIATGAEVTAGTDTAKAVVPSTLKTELDKKVDKVAGKGLSTNDYDNTEKAKVAAAETETTLGIDTASGDTTKFLNQKKQWVVPAGGSGSAPDASTSTKGIIQIATGAEVTAGTDTAKAVVPSTLKTELDKKVDKVAGKGLSTNDYDNTEKAKVAAALTSVPDASTTGKGVIQIATGAVVADGTDSTRAVVPSTLKTALDKKVDNVAGKGLSTNDYDNTEKAKVAAAETETTLGLDPAAGDTTKFLNQKKQWAVPAGVELLYTMPAPGIGDVGRVALFTGESTGAYVQNNLYRAVMEAAINPTGSITVSGGTSYINGTYAYVSGTGDSRLWQRTDGSMVYQIYYSGGYWVIHSYEDDGYDGMIHMDECRGSGASGSNPWGVTWETSWDEGTSGNNGTVPTVAGSSVATYVWRPLLPPLTTFASTTPTIYPGGRYTNFNPSEGVMNGAFTFNIGGYEGCYGDAEVIMVVPPSGVTVSGGPGLVLVDSLVASKRNYCVVKFYGTAAKLFVVHTEDL